MSERPIREIELDAYVSGNEMNRDEGPYQSRSPSNCFMTLFIQPGEGLRFKAQGREENPRHCCSYAVRNFTGHTLLLLRFKVP